VLCCKRCNCVCNAIHFQRNFDNWTSGNNDIDKFIHKSQLSAHYNANKALEWISYNRFYDIQYILASEFGKIYRANWVDGYMDQWNNEDQNWDRRDQSMYVILKSLNNPNDVTSAKLMKEV